MFGVWEVLGDRYDLEAKAKWEEFLKERGGTERPEGVEETELKA
jgi:hypothetical protein